MINSKKRDSLNNMVKKVMRLKYPKGFSGTELNVKSKLKEWKNIQGQLAKGTFNPREVRSYQGWGKKI